MAGDSKTEKATPKKRRDERKKGNVFKSQDINSLVTLFGAFFALQALFPLMRDAVSSFTVFYIEQIADIHSGTIESLRRAGTDFMLVLVKACVPIMLICMLLGILATGVQTKFLFVSKNFRPKFSRLNPLNGIKNIFSLKNAVDLLKNILKITLLGIIIYMMVKDDMVSIVRTMNMPITQSVSYMFEQVIALMTRVAMIFVAIAGFDFFYQWWDYERQIKMSKQEVKEEYKQMEGNPEVKAKIREIQRQRARMRMMQAVPQADVVIRNPTHFAVALRYRIDQDNAPVVVAKGQDELALRIVKIAEDNDVAVLENKPLARALYAQTAIDQEIPSEYYGTVAEILIYVYKMKKKKVENQ